MNIHSFRKRTLRVLWARDDETLALELLRRDPLYLHIPTETAPELLGLALSIGRGEAKDVRREFGSADPLRLARAMNVRVLFDIVQQPPQPFTVLSRYLPRPPTILIHEAALRRCRERLAGHELGGGVIVSDLTNICVAHELYHHRERAAMRFVNLAYRVPVLKLGFLRVEKSITALGEIAAHAFAKELLDLPYLPCCLDPMLFDADQQTRPPRE